MQLSLILNCIKAGGNGFLFLEKLGALELCINPYILITTNNISQITYDRVRQLGADFIISKYQEDYNAESVINFLRSMKSTILHNARKNGITTELITTETAEQISERIKKGLIPSWSLSVSVLNKLAKNILLMQFIKL